MAGQMYKPLDLAPVTTILVVFRTKFSHFPPYYLFLWIGSSLFGQLPSL